MKRKIIVVTPIKNEAWILKSFLNSLVNFADLIILGNHNSTDESLMIAKSFSNVIIVDSHTQNFDEATRRNLLLDKAREFGPNNFILALDADEIISQSFLNLDKDDFLSYFLNGERLHIERLNLLPSSFDFWREKIGPIGFIDDGTTLNSKHIIHFARVPEMLASKKYIDPQLYLIHLQAMNSERFFRKQKWYILWECIYNDKSSLVKIYRRYEYLKELSILREETLPSNVQTYLDKLGKFPPVFSNNAEHTFNIDDLSLEASEIALKGYKFIAKKINLIPNSETKDLIFQLLDIYFKITSKAHPRKRNIWVKGIVFIFDGFIDLILRFYYRKIL